MDQAEQRKKDQRERKQRSRQKIKAATEAKKAARAAQERARYHRNKSMSRRCNHQATATDKMQFKTTPMLQSSPFMKTLAGVIDDQSKKGAPVDAIMNFTAQAIQLEIASFSAHRDVAVQHERTLQEYQNTEQESIVLKKAESVRKMVGEGGLVKLSDNQAKVAIAAATPYLAFKDKDAGDDDDEEEEIIPTKLVFQGSPESNRLHLDSSKWDERSMEVKEPDEESFSTPSSVSTFLSAKEADEPAPTGWNYSRSFFPQWPFGSEKLSEVTKQSLLNPNIPESADRGLRNNSTNKPGTPLPSVHHHDKKIMSLLHTREVDQSPFEAGFVGSSPTRNTTSDLVSAPLLKMSRQSKEKFQNRFEQLLLLHRDSIEQSFYDSTAFSSSESELYKFSHYSISLALMLHNEWSDVDVDDLKTAYDSNRCDDDPIIDLETADSDLKMKVILTIQQSSALPSILGFKPLPVDFSKMTVKKLKEILCLKKASIPSKVKKNELVSMATSSIMVSPKARSMIHMLTNRNTCTKTLKEKLVKFSLFDLQQIALHTSSDKPCVDSCTAVEQLVDSILSKYQSKADKNTPKISKKERIEKARANVRQRMMK